MNASHQAILIPLRLGISSVSSEYVEALKVSIVAVSRN